MCLRYRPVNPDVNIDPADGDYFTVERRAIVNDFFGLNLPGIQELDISVPPGVPSPSTTGSWPVLWQAIPCPYDGPMVYKYRPGSSRFFILFNILLHKCPISFVEISSTGPGGPFFPADRVTANSFQYLPLDVGNQQLTNPFHIRITSSFGEVIVDPKPVIPPEAIPPLVEIVGSVQFSQCPNVVDIPSQVPTALQSSSPTSGPTAFQSSSPTFGPTATLSIFPTLLAPTPIPTPPQSAYPTLVPTMDTPAPSV